MRAGLASPRGAPQGGSPCSSDSFGWRADSEKLRSLGAAARARQRDEDAAAIRAAQALWERSREAGPAVRGYLAQRRLGDIQSPAIRELPVWRDQPLAMLVAATNLAGEVRQAQRTPLGSATFKRAVDREGAPLPKRSRGRLQGGAVHLIDRSDAEALIVGEGVESALSAWRILSGCGVRLSCWATLGSAGLKGVDLPTSTSWLVIAADIDLPNPKTGVRAGGAAALELQARAKAAGWQAEIAWPPIPADSAGDWNDVLMREGDQ